MIFAKIIESNIMKINFYDIMGILCLTSSLITAILITCGNLTPS
jgi:hypothetical protein